MKNLKKAMKNLIFAFVALFSSYLFSQDMTEKYNDLYGRYEYFDKNGNLVAYKKYNDLYGRWETFFLNAEKRSERKDENFDLLFKVMEMKQKRIDEQRGNNLSQISYNNSMKDLENRTYAAFNKIDLKYLKQNEKNIKKHNSKSKSLQKKINKSKFYNINDLKDGWYPVIIENNKTFVERYVYVELNKIKFYLDGLNSIYNVKNTNSTDDLKYNFVKIYPDNETDSNSCYFTSKNKLKKDPDYNRVAVVKFYTTSEVDSNKGIFIRVCQSEVEDHNFPGIINEQLPYGKKVECIDNNSYYSYKLYLPIDKVYSYQAFDNYTFWHSSFYLTESCKIINLKKNY